MTGFGRSEVVTDERKITIELKSVNHRYLDLSIKMPKKLSFLEGSIRNLMKTYIQRGKVDVYITYEDYTINNGTLKYNKELAAEYIACLKQIQQDFDLDYDIKVSTLSRYPDILTMEEQSVDEEELWSILEPPVREQWQGTTARQPPTPKAVLRSRVLRARGPSKCRPVNDYIEDDWLPVRRGGVSRRG